VLLSASLYWVLGDASRVAQKNAEKPMTQESVEKMVEEINEEMQQHNSK
jgi:cytochrome c-type biogenesis protein CcmH